LNVASDVGKAKEAYQADQIHLKEIVVSPAKSIGAFELRSAIVRP
jgi:hypothetical protein